MQMMPKISCPHRVPSEAVAWAGAAVAVVVAISFPQNEVLYARTHGLSLVYQDMAPCHIFVTRSGVAFFDAVAPVAAPHATVAVLFAWGRRWWGELLGGERITTTAPR